jgi:hypothetical protein
VGQDHRLELALGLHEVAVLPGQHVHLSLVHAQLADVRLYSTSITHIGASVCLMHSRRAIFNKTGRRVCECKEGARCYRDREHYVHR